ncbi:hypoxanthine-guanine phosphoribosyltransferase [Acidihalobacter ferrooxydans]|uniref:hypoxanthine-guanine phosphoribosyltransferase n=1 Tax=Acidihalobacter ferrooxydans TaxID=1765967 RepID=UPI001E550DA6|nr:hypoxanthine-guanine phosphoribosyltransferase [Acidihalobacter ferrooxydans]
MITTAADARRVLENAECLHTAGDVEQALDALAASITESFGDKDPLLLVIMTGGFVFAGQLLTRLEFPLQVDYLHATRYRSGTTGHEVQWRARPKLSLDGRHVLVLDDILDEGHTLAAVLEDCRQAGAASVGCAVLVEKHHDRKYAGLKADFVGLGVADKFVFGHGLDYHEYLRNVSGIYAVCDPA